MGQQANLPPLTDQEPSSERGLVRGADLLFAIATTLSHMDPARTLLAFCKVNGDFCGQPLSIGASRAQMRILPLDRVLPPAKAARDGSEGEADASRFAD